MSERKAVLRRTDICETPDNIVVLAEALGVSADNVDVGLDRWALTFWGGESGIGIGLPTASRDRTWT